jgi:hypothetical protein
MNRWEAEKELGAAAFCVPSVERATVRRSDRLRNA